MKHELTVSIDGMHCDACVRRVTSALLAIDGVTLGKVEVGSAKVSFDSTKVTSEQIAQAIDGIGFKVVARQ